MLEPFLPGRILTRSHRFRCYGTGTLWTHVLSAPIGTSAPKVSSPTFAPLFSYLSSLHSWATTHSPSDSHDPIFHSVFSYPRLSSFIVVIFLPYHLAPLRRLQFLIISLNTVYFCSCFCFQCHLCIHPCSSR
jgi:hypothetical protein